MDDAMQNILTWHNGEKSHSPFSKSEMSRRQNAMRKHLDMTGLDACLFTSYHNICYFSGFMYCAFGRRFAMVLTPTDAKTITPAIDGGQPWRRSFADNLTYTGRTAAKLRDARHVESFPIYRTKGKTNKYRSL